MGDVKQMTTMLGLSLWLMGIGLLSCGREEGPSQLEQLQQRLKAMQRDAILDQNKEDRLKRELAQAYVAAANQDSAGIDPAIYLFRAAELLEAQVGQSPKALLLYQRIRNDFPEHPLGAEATFRQGWLYANYLRDTARAQQVLIEFVQLYPDHELVPNVPTELEQIGLSPAEAHNLMRAGLAADTLKVDSTATQAEEAP